jgi:imidazolonepropionase
MSKRSALTIFSDISQLYSLSAFASKAGRRPVEDDLKPIQKAAMVVSTSGEILWLGAQRGLLKVLKNEFSGFKKREISLRGLKVYPGFVEPHTHLVFAGERSEEFEWRLTGVDYATISKRGGGIFSTVKAVRKSSPAVLTRIARERMKRFTGQGVTTLEIKTGYGLSPAQEIKLLKVIESLKGPRVVSCYLGGHALPPEYSGREIDYIQDVAVPTLRRVHKNFNCRRADIFIEKGFFSLKGAEVFMTEAKRLGFDIAVHAEQLTRQGSTELLLKYGAKSLDHGVHLSETDIKRLASSEVTMVALPAADFYLKCPYPPARELLDQGGRVALGTDYNPGTSPTTDLAFVGLLARTEMKMTIPEVWCAYTVSAAYALGLNEVCGSLEIGKAADFLVSEACPSEFFYEVGYTPVQEVYCKGRRLRP